MGEALQTIAAYLHFNSGRLDKLQGKVMTHSEKVEWWIILMVDCVTLFFYFIIPQLLKRKMITPANFPKRFTVNCASLFCLPLHNNQPLPSSAKFK